MSKNRRSAVGSVLANRRPAIRIDSCSTQRIGVPAKKATAKKGGTRGTAKIKMIQELKVEVDGPEVAIAMRGTCPGGIPQRRCAVARLW
jgi:hypothetical protein